MYDLLIRPFVQRLSIEKASVAAMRYFTLLGHIPGFNFLSRLIHGNRPQGLEIEVFGLNFYNPVGLGAGLDRKGDLYYNLENLGFSFVEAGPLDSSAARHAIETVQQRPHNDILAACINRDYLLTYSLAYDFYDFFVIEVGAEDYVSVLSPILDCRLSYDGYKPLVVKLPEVVSVEKLEEMVGFCRMNGVDGVETRSIEQTRHIAGLTLGRFPIIANSHICTPQEARAELDAGASLIEVRSGLVTEGPRLIARILKYLSSDTDNATNR